MNRAEFEEKLNLFKFYLADNFYQDNIGQVEITWDNGQLVNTTFSIPSYFHHLTKASRKQIPQIAYNVSQNEKIEIFMKNILSFEAEMKWQQRMGQIFMPLKIFSNYWNEISMFNFVQVCLMNILFLQNLTIGFIYQVGEIIKINSDATQNVLNF